MKNFLAVTLLSLGIPMIVMGDEVRRTQLGNNNAYCQDNETSWMDWSLLERHADIHRFARLLIQRRSLRDFTAERERRTLMQFIRGGNKAWHGVRLNAPDWSDNSHSLAFSAEMRNERLLVYVAMNAYWEPLEFELPPTEYKSKTPWHRWIDTSLESPCDIVEWHTAPIVLDGMYRVGPRSVVVLYARMSKT